MSIRTSERLTKRREAIRALELLERREARLSAKLAELRVAIIAAQRGVAEALGVPLADRDGDGGGGA